MGWVEVAAAGATLGIAAVLKSAANGHLRRAWSAWRDRRQVANGAHRQVEEVAQGVERIEQKVDEGFDRMETTVAYLHREDLQDDPLVRDRLDIEADDDILRGGTNGDD